MAKVVTLEAKEEVLEDKVVKATTSLEEMDVSEDMEIILVQMGKIGLETM
jgi:hypothetical protein